MAERMKESGNQWIGEIPESWSVEKIKYLIKQDKDGIRVGPFGSTLKEVVLEADKGDYKVYGQANLIQHDFSIGSNFISESDYRRLSAYEINPGDVLLSMMGTIGKCSVVPNDIQKGIMDSHLIKMRLSNRMDARYLEYVYEHSGLVFEQLLINSNGTTMNGLNSSVVKAVVVPLPSMVEQQAIADFLDKRCAQIDDVIADLEKQKLLLEEYRLSSITETVTIGMSRDIKSKKSQYVYFDSIPENWDEKRIKYLIKGIKDGTHGTFDRLYEGEMLLSAKNVFNTGLKISEQESMISEKDYKSIVSNGYPGKGDVLLSCVGTIGRTCVYELDKPLAFQRSTIFLRPIDKLNPYFLSYALQSKHVLEQESNLVNKSAQDGLYMGAVKEIVIPMPNDIEEQNKIVEYLNKKTRIIDNKIAGINKKLFIAKNIRNP